MNKLTVFLLISIALNVSYANYLDDWTDEDLCGWIDADLVPEHISDEMFKRKVVCENVFDFTKLSNQKPYASENGTVFPSPIKVGSSKPKLQFRLNYKITL